MLDVANASTRLLCVEGLTVALPRGMERPHAVKDISFELRAGEILCIIGESGSGKSVTANAVMGLLPSALKIEGGRICLRGTDLLGGEGYFGRADRKTLERARVAGPPLRGLVRRS